MNDQLINLRMAKILASGVALCFLVIHIVMYNLFKACGVTPMVYFNMFSMAFYVFAQFMVYKEWLWLYSVSVYVEVVAHMSAAVLCVGWASGFQITLIGMNVMAFFAEYVGRATSIKHISGLALSVLGMCTYLAILEISHYYPAPYTLSEEVSFWLQIAWGIIVFVIATSILQIFVLSVFKSEEVLFVRMSHDKLTGLPNRYYMSDYLKKVFAAGELGLYWMAMLDIDNFKNINDTYGHNCGDFVLQTLADIMRDTEPNVELCRWGGEEFLLVGKFDANKSLSVSQELDRLRKAVAEHTFWYDEQKLKLSVTIGAAQYEPGISISEWINVADKRLYEGKRNGKNQVVA